MFERPKQWLNRVGLKHDFSKIPESVLFFPDGGTFRIEIPEVENAEVLHAMILTADKYGVPVHRVSQGTGITKLSDNELKDIAMLGRENSIEVFLFMGVRGENGLGAYARSDGGGSAKKRLQGISQLVHALEDVHRALEAGIRGFLVSDEGLLDVLSDLRQSGEVPADVALKTSVSMGHGNPASVKVLEKLGADSVNLPVDLPLEALAAIRQAISVPVDQYIEAPRTFGGSMRLYDIPDIVRIASPVNLKFGLSTEELTDPVGLHTQHIAILQIQERIRLASLGMEILSKEGLLSNMSPVAKDRAGIPAG